MRTNGASVLWIARMRFIEHLRLREVELAHCVARRARVVALDRSDSRGWEELSVSSKLRLRWDMATGGWARWNGGDLERFRMPVWLGAGPGTSRVAAWINERNVTEARRRFGCETVYHSDPLVFLPPPKSRRSYRVHFDLVDNFFDMWPDSLVGRSRKRFLSDAMLRADSLTSISHSLCDRVEQFIGRRPAYMPNGAHLEEMRSWPASRASRIRKRHSLEGKTVLALIGNHHLHNHGTEMLLDAFHQARRARPTLELLLIGPGADQLLQNGSRGAEGLHVVGPVPTCEISDYFHAADLGLLPFRLDAATHHALPIKVLEFGAAGKPMLASPLDELKRLDLPHVRFVEFNTAAWRDALIDDRSYAKPAHLQLEASLRPFCWDRIAEGLIRTMGLA